MITLHHGDSRDVLKTLASDSIDSVCTDPPYALVSIVKRFGSATSKPAQGNDAYMRASAGFMGKQWDTGETAMSHEFWSQVYRVLKPGAFVAAFGASRGYHRMACAIEDAGFEIRDSLMWVYGTGFPKSHDVSKGIDKAAGAEREVIGSKTITGMTVDRETFGASDRSDGKGMGFRPGIVDITAPATAAAREWEGWGTALKPAHEPITVASKPLTLQQHFAILLEYITDLLEEQAIWSGLNVHVAETNFSAIRAKLDAVTKHIALDSAKMRVLARFDPARFAEQNSIFHDPEFCVAIKTKDDSVPSSARPQSSVASYLALTTPHGPADDLSIQLAAMCMSVITAGISESTVSSWANLSDAILTRANTFTTETASRLTIALKTWNSLISPHTIDGTGNLSPNVSPIVLARKPLSEGTVAANVLRWRTGALNIGACRVPTDETITATRNIALGSSDGGIYGAANKPGVYVQQAGGRWPANVVLTFPEDTFTVRADIDDKQRAELEAWLAENTEH